MAHDPPGSSSARRESVGRKGRYAPVLIGTGDLRRAIGVLMMSASTAK